MKKLKTKWWEYSYLLMKKKCEDYFKRYFENQAKEKLTPYGIKNFVNTMEHWCTDANEMSQLKGLVIHLFNFLVYFDKWFYDKFNEEQIFKDLDIEDFSSTPIIIGYNLKENAVLLIWKSGKKGIQTQVELCTSDMKMLMLLFGNELKRSAIKVVSLFASNLEVHEILNCEGCEHSIG